MRKIAETTSKLELINSHATEITVHIEPWGDQYVMAPDVTFQIEARGPANGQLEICIGPGEVLVWGWSGSIVSIFHEGVDLDEGLGPRQPSP